MKTLRLLTLIIMTACAGIMLSSCDPADFIEQLIPDINDEDGKDEDENSGNEDKENGGDDSSEETDGEKGDEDDEQNGYHDGTDDSTPGFPEVDNTGFVILFTNDFHSQIEPLDDGRGGVLRLKALVDSVRTAEPYVLLADAGDLVQGSDYFSLLNGVVEMTMLDILGYDIRTVGNHEFDKKMTGLGEMLALSKVPVVASNYDFSNTDLAHYVVPSKILDAGGLKIGFIGLNVRLLNLVDPKACEGVIWQDAVNVADSYAQQLRDQGADMVIAISHLGYGAGSDAYYYDRGIAMRTSHIDMIIGGHSHTTLRTADYITSADGDLIPVVQTGSRGANLGYAKIRFDENGRPDFEYRLIPVNSRLDDRTDPAFADIISTYAAEVKEKTNVRLGYSRYDITRTTNSNKQSRLGNLTADGLIWIAKEFYDTDADISIYNSGGIRANIERGDVTLGDVYAVYPFDNIVSILEVKGSDLRELFSSVCDGSLPVGGNIKLTISGGNMTSVLVNNKQIVDNQTYTVVTIDYLANLGRYGLSNAISRWDGPEFVRDLFGEYFRYIAENNDGYIDGPLDDRIIVEE